MTLTAEHTVKILTAIEGNHAFQPELSVPFITPGGAVGYIPQEHLETYTELRDQKDAPLFHYDAEQNALLFADRLDTPAKKTGAIKYAREQLIAKGLFKPPYVPEPQFRAIGGADRLVPGREEAVIDRNEYRLLGFPSDAVFLNVIIENGQQAKIMLQVRDDNGLHDFAAGGAVKYPQSVEDALLAQIKEEMGVDVDGIEPVGGTNFKFSTPAKGWVTNQTHNLFQIRKPMIEVGKDYNQEEVTGFVQVTPEEAIELCAEGRFQKQNVQAFMTSLFLADLVPEFEGREELRETLAQHYSEPVIAEPEPNAAANHSLVL